VTEKFEAYSGGVFCEKRSGPAEINHEVSLVGWGKDADTGKRFWVGRNSWGTYWGEMGFFRIEMGQNNNGIEEACVWAAPKI
jgi:cathepsin X